MSLNRKEIERIKASHDLATVVRSWGVELKGRGKSLMGLCPFHKDRNPSFVVNSEKQLWNCLGACSANGGKSGGDVIEFVEKIGKLSFPEALRRLGGQVPGQTSPSKGTQPSKRQKTSSGPPQDGSIQFTAENELSRRVELLKPAVGYYHRIFREKPEGQDYLRSRGLADPQILSAFQVGYVDGSIPDTLDLEKIHEYQKLGLLNSRGREMFLRCVVFPLTLPDIGVVGLYGRNVKGSRHLYLPGPRRGVFHWQAMKASNEIILTESVLDALTLFHAGFRNVSAIYGVNGFTSDHADLLARFRVRRVHLFLDNDEAGTKATDSVSKKLQKLGIEVTDVRVPGAKDPNDLFTALGAEAAAAAIREALRGANVLSDSATVSGGKSPLLTPPPGSLDSVPVDSGVADQPDSPVPSFSMVSPEEGGGWMVQLGKRSYRVRGLKAADWDRLKVALRVQGKGRMHLDRLDLNAQRSRMGLVKEMARLFEEPEEEIIREVGQLIEILEKIRLDLKKSDSKKADPGKIEIPEKQREEALTMLRSPDLLERILGDFERFGVVGEKTALELGYLVTISRFLDNPLGLLTVSRSGAGKSSLQDALCDFVPPEQLAKYTRITGQSLFYKESDSLAHRVLAIDEEIGAEEAAYSIRNLQSAQVLRIAVTCSDPLGGRFKAEEHEVRGPVAITLTTTSTAPLDDETRSRFVQVSMDESIEQTRRILMRQREAETLEGLRRRKESEAIRRKHHNLQRLLRPLQVVIPFAKNLEYPDHLLQMRREQKKYLTIIKAIALLHQHQREVKKVRVCDKEFEYVEAQPRDVKVANRLAREVLGQSLDELTPSTRQLLKYLSEMSGGRKEWRFTRKDVRNTTGWKDSQVRNHLGQLLQLEYVELVSGRNGQQMTYRLIFEGDPDRDRRFLAGLVDVEELLQ